MFVTNYAQPATRPSGFVLVPGMFAIEIKVLSGQPHAGELIANTARVQPRLVLL